jgi:hypothetical protein
MRMREQTISLAEAKTFLYMKPSESETTKFMKSTSEQVVKPRSHKGVTRIGLLLGSVGAAYAVYLYFDGWNRITHRQRPPQSVQPSKQEESAHAEGAIQPPWIASYTAYFNRMVEVQVQTGSALQNANTAEEVVLALRAYNKSFETLIERAVELDDKYPQVKAPAGRLVPSELNDIGSRLEASQQRLNSLIHSAGSRYATSQAVLSVLSEMETLPKKAVPEAQYKLALSLAETGDDVDDAKAVGLYRMAADQGHVEAQFKLGEILVAGRGVRRDLQEALQLFTAAADKNHAEACFHIGFMYDEGSGVRQDPIEAEKWYRRASELGSKAGEYGVQSIQSRNSRGNANKPSSNK